MVRANCDPPFELLKNRPKPYELGNLGRHFGDAEKSDFWSLGSARVLSEGCPLRLGSVSPFSSLHPHNLRAHTADPNPRGCRTRVAPGDLDHSLPIQPEDVIQANCDPPLELLKSSPKSYDLGSLGRHFGDAAKSYFWSLGSGDPNLRGCNHTSPTLTAEVAASGRRIQLLRLQHPVPRMPKEHPKERPRSARERDLDHSPPI